MKANITYTYKFDPSESEFWSHETEQDMLNVLTSNIKNGFYRVLFEHEFKNKVSDFSYYIKHDKNTFEIIIESEYPIHRCEEFLEDFCASCFEDLMSQFSVYYSKHNVEIKNWIEVQTKPGICSHSYKHLQFMAVGDKIQELKKCEKCEEVFAFDVKKGK